MKAISIAIIKGVYLLLAGNIKRSHPFTLLVDGGRGEGKGTPPYLPLFQTYHKGSKVFRYSHAPPLPPIHTHTDGKGSSFQTDESMETSKIV